MNNAEVATESVLKVVAPEEIFLFKRRDQVSVNTADGALGFGASIDINLVYPILLSFFTILFGEFSKQASKSLYDFLVKKLFKKNDSVADEDLIKKLAHNLVSDGLNEEIANKAAIRIIEVVRFSNEKN